VHERKRRTVHDMVKIITRTYEPSDIDDCRRSV